jgi:hypothetical protein
MKRLFTLLILCVSFGFCSDLYAQAGDFEIIFIRGDFNQDSLVTHADATQILDFLFKGIGVSACDDATDVNDDGLLTGADASYILNFLYLAGPPIPEPGPFHCGVDDTEDDLDCDYYNELVCP